MTENFSLKVINVLVLLCTDFFIVQLGYCCVSNYLISSLRDHFSARIPDSASGQFTSGSARSLKRQLVD